MGGEIRVVRKNGPGTLMQLYLCLSAPADVPGENLQLKFAEHNLKVLLALKGKMGRSIMSQWLRKIGVYTWEASEWNELTQRLQEIFKTRSYAYLKTEHSKAEPKSMQDLKSSVFIVVVDIGLLNLSTEIWKEQLNFLDTYNRNRRAKFAWILNHDTSNTIKTELRSRGHLLMANEPLYKAKMIQIMEAVIKEVYLELQKKTILLGPTTLEGDMHECLEIDPIHSDAESSNDSDILEIESSNSIETFQIEERHQGTFIPSSVYGTVSDCFIELTEVCSERNKLSPSESSQTTSSSCDISNQGYLEGSNCKEQCNQQLNKAMNEHKSLGGLCILLAEDTPVLQRVATIMLEKMGATVVVVGDGVQAVEALKVRNHNGKGKESFQEDGTTTLQGKTCNSLRYDLILMDCQMPKMDGYEATKAIRRAEWGTESHIPIVALTAHAMSSDEAKCLEVGMDAYLTKPIDCNLMVSTILSLTKRAA